MTREAWSWHAARISSNDVRVTGDVVHITVESEEPRAKDGTVLPRRGNRYYPTMVYVRINDDVYDDGSPRPSLILLDEDARTLGEALIDAAKEARDTDTPDTDPCGHWHPCDCEPKR